MAGESELATVTGEGIGRIDSSKNINWCGSLFFSTSSTGKLASLNNLIGVFEAVIDAEGNFTEKTWLIAYIKELDQPVFLWIFEKCIGFL